MRFVARRNHKLNTAEGSKKPMDCSSQTIFKLHIFRNIFCCLCHLTSGRLTRRNIEFYASDGCKSLTNRGSKIFSDSTEAGMLATNSTSASRASASIERPFSAARTCNLRLVISSTLRIVRVAMDAE